MMLAKKAGILLLTALIIVAGNIQPVLGKADLAQWKFSKDIRLEGSSKYRAVFLDDETYKHSAGDLSDVRVVNQKSEFVPYYLKNSYYYENKSSFTYEAREINNYLEYNDNFVDFKVTPIDANTDILANSLEFSIQDKSFVKKIDIYGSYDNEVWQYLMSDSIYRVDNVAKTGVKFSNTQKYKYYRIKIPNNLENITIKKLQVIDNFIEKGSNSFIRNSTFKFETENKDKSTFIKLHNENRLKLKKISFQVDENFNRSYEVSVKEGENYVPYGVNGRIYNLQFKDVNLKNPVIDFSRKPLSSEFIQVRLMNNDDQPLDIKSIEVEYFVDKVVFEVKPGESYKLYFGSTNAQKPVYDIESYKNYIEKETQDTCQLSSMAAYEAIQKTEKTVDYKFWFNISLGVLSVLLIFIIVRKLNVKA